jgi:hypothetical protein
MKLNFQTKTAESLSRSPLFRCPLIPEPLLTRPTLPVSGYHCDNESLHGPRKLRAGAASLVDNHTADHRKLEQNTARQIIWTSTHTFQGWTCSQCDWNYPIPTFLNDPDARTAYDRLAAAKFRDHKCAEHSTRQGSPDDADSFTPRIRKLVTQGFKPKDAVELFLQEVALEYRNQPKVLAQAKSDAEDFLRRVRAGLI